MAQDALGLEITTGSQDAVTAWNSAVFDFLEARLSLGEQIKASLAADPDFVLALCFRGYFLMQLSSVSTAGKVAGIISQAQEHASDATLREQMHVRALEYWSQGQVSQTRKIWEDILVEAPRDLLALRLHHFASFWQGDRASLRDAPASILGQVENTMPGYGFVQGMFAFGLEETGDYARAEKFAREAIGRNEDDLWALHSFAHILEMQCRHKEGADLLERPFGTWSDRNPFKDHVWWHRALFALELGDFENMLEIYDKEVRVDEGGFYLDVQNAASLLQRMELYGVDTGERWEELADLAVTRLDDHVIPFTDAHFMLALIGGGRLEAARSYIGSLKRFAGRDKGEAAIVTGQVTLPLAEGLLAYGEERYGEAADALYALRHNLGPLGGSHAQQDIFHQLLIDAMMKAKRISIARTLLAERQMLRPGSSWVGERLNMLQ